MEGYKMEKKIAIQILRDLILCVERGTLVPNETIKSVCGQEYCDAIRIAAPTTYSIALDTVLEK